MAKNLNINVQTGCIIAYLPLEEVCPGITFLLKANHLRSPASLAFSFRNFQGFGLLTPNDLINILPRRVFLSPLPIFYSLKFADKCIKSN